MSLPGSVTITEYSCTTSGSGTLDCTANPCDNPLYALDNPTDCDAVLSSLRIEPPSQTVVKGRAGLVRLVAHFADGREADRITAASPAIPGSPIAFALSRLMTNTPTGAGSLDASITCESTPPISPRTRSVRSTPRKVLDLRHHLHHRPG